MVIYHGQAHKLVAAQCGGSDGCGGVTAIMGLVVTANGAALEQEVVVHQRCNDGMDFGQSDVCEHVGRTVGCL